MRRVMRGGDVWDYSAVAKNKEQILRCGGEGAEDSRDPTGGEAVRKLMRCEGYGSAVAGMHGKNRKTPWLRRARWRWLEPTVWVGGRVHALGSEARLGRSSI